MNIRFLDEAKREFLDATAYYEAASRGASHGQLFFPSFWSVAKAG